MGEKPDQPFQLSFNASLKGDFQGGRVISDCGAANPDHPDGVICFPPAPST